MVLPNVDMPAASARVIVYTCTCARWRRHAREHGNLTLAGGSARFGRVLEGKEG